MNLQSETFKAQSDFSAYCRTGIYHEIPGTKPDGLKQYRKLVFGVISDAVENSYPIAADYLGEAVWNEMVQSFFSNHKCQSFQVWNIAGEFYEFAKSQNWAEKYKIPLLNDLLHFEWTETEMYNMKDLEVARHKPSGDYLYQVPVFNPEFRILKFTYPVHLIKPEAALSKPSEYFVLVYRNLENGRIHFLDLSVLRVWMIEQMAVYGKTLEQSLVTAGVAFGKIDPEITNSSINFLKYLHQKKFLLGFKPAESNN
jgi:uncharacterized protein